MWSYKDQERRARAVLAAWGLDAEARVFLDEATGAALLALLCNAGAKFLNRADLYAHKHALIARAISLAGDWWAKPHTGYVSPYPRPDGAGDYIADTVIYIQTELGRMSFHVDGSDPELAHLVQQAPKSDRGWDGVALQPIARELAEQWIRGRRQPLDQGE